MSLKLYWRLLKSKTEKGLIRKKVRVFLSKAQPDGIFEDKKKVNIKFEFGKNGVSTFKSEPTGSLFFELVPKLLPSKLGTMHSKPIHLRVPASCTSPFVKSSILFPLSVLCQNDNNSLESGQGKQWLIPWQQVPIKEEKVPCKQKVNFLTPGLRTSLFFKMVVLIENVLWVLYKYMGKHGGLNCNIYYYLFCTLSRIIS